jgi:uncharacterized protein
VELKNDGTLVLSATDVSNYLVWRHLTALDLRVANRLLTVPPSNDPSREALAARGLEHETRYLDSLTAQDLRFENLNDLRGPAAVEATLAAMWAGHDVIAQGTRQQGWWAGRPDALRRVDAPSALGALS